jgi:ech hydrogenase subunit A
MDTFHKAMPSIISTGNTNIMLMMLCLILILPVAVRLLTFGKKNKIVLSYMSGANAGDDRNFTNSFGAQEKLYLSNWYMENYFGEKKILKPSLVFAAAVIIILMVIAIGGAV